MNGDLQTLSHSELLRPQEGAAETTPHNGRWLLLFATLATVLLWFVPDSNYLLYPLRLFVTYIHESGHAVAALLSGQTVYSLRVNPNASGVTMTSGSPFWNWLTLSGGYLGAILFGALLLQVGRLGRWRNAGKVSLYAFAAYLLTITLLWGRDPFTLAAGAALAALFWVAGRFVKPRAAVILASFLAVQCSLNAFSDLFNVLYLSTYTQADNDAKFMAQNYALPATFWALLWAAIAVVVMGLSLRSYWRATSPRTPK